ncbi:unnamed protein product, partial [Ascophyllum nodosum]
MRRPRQTFWSVREIMFATGCRLVELGHSIERLSVHMAWQSHRQTVYQANRHPSQNMTLAHRAAQTFFLGIFRMLFTRIYITVVHMHRATNSTVVRSDEVQQAGELCARKSFHQ